MDTTEQQDYDIDGASVHQQDINTQAKNVQDGGGTMNGIYLQICLLVILLYKILAFALFIYLSRSNLLIYFLFRHTRMLEMS